MNSRTTNILSTGAVVQEVTGSFKYLKIRAATNSVQISFDGMNWVNANIDDSFGPLQPQPTRIYFKALNSLASVVTFNYSDQPFSAQSTSQKVAPTFLRGNGGQSFYYTAPKARNVTPADFQIGGAVAVDLTQGPPLVVPGTYQGHQRKSVLFQVDTGGGDIVVFDANGGLVQHLAPNSVPQVLETSDTYYVLGLGGAASKVFYSEIYFAT